jgi:DNA-binding MarR family transcriptional regulator
MSASQKENAMPTKKFDEARQAAILQLHDLRTVLETLEENRYLVKAGITYSQYLVLLTVQSTDPPVPESAISRVVNHNLNSISMIADRMEKLGLISRARSKDDRREVHVALTDLGKQKLADAIKVGVPLTDRLCSSFSDEELARMVALVEKLQAGIAAELGSKATGPSSSGASRDHMLAMLKSASRRA